MKAILTASFILLASQAGALEVIMACGSHTYKYTKFIWNAAKVERRYQSLVWQDFCDDQNEILYFSDLKATCDSRHTDSIFPGLVILDFKRGSHVFRMNEFEDAPFITNCTILKK